jgi:hypothetical protein
MRGSRKTKLFGRGERSDEIRVELIEEHIICRFDSRKSLNRANAIMAQFPSMPSGPLIGIRSTILFSADSQIRTDRWKMTICRAKGFPKLNDKVQSFGIEFYMEMNLPP